MFILNRDNTPTNIVVRDMDGVQVEPGDLVEVQHCVGPYGQTAKVRGTLVMANHFGVYLTFDVPYYTCSQKFGSHTYKVGERVQFAIPNNNGVFFDECHDFEHGHQKYMKKL